MFLKAIGISAFLLVFILSLLIVQVGWVRSQDFARYQAKEKIPSNSSTSVHQRRRGVCKDIWLTQEGGKTRIHQRIESQSSVLSLLTKDNKVDVIENLKNVRACMQEKSPFEKGGIMRQHIRYFEANQSSYYYLKKQLLAKEVTIFLLDLPGDKLPEKCPLERAYLNGVAEDIVFSISSHHNFTAKQFKAHLNKL
jgi:hypothetical protein